MHTRYVVAHCCVVAHYCVVAHCGSSLFSLNLRSIRPYGYAPQLRCKISNKFAMHKSRVPPSPRTPRTSARSCRIPTSNRNYFAVSKQQYSVVYHYNPTSNRNDVPNPMSSLAVVYHYNPTSNRNGTHGQHLGRYVVYHYNPTSNRNCCRILNVFCIVVYHYNPTSNRNYNMSKKQSNGLYIIIILHQTATKSATVSKGKGCISL